MLRSSELIEDNLHYFSVSREERESEREEFIQN